MPWAAPVVAAELAVMESEPLEVEKVVPVSLNPLLAEPVPPWIVFVATTGPAAEKAVELLIPWLDAPLPPTHPVIVTVPSVIDEPNVTVPEVPVVHALVLMEMP